MKPVTVAKSRYRSAVLQAMDALPKPKPSPKEVESVGKKVVAKNKPAKKARAK